MNEHTIQIQNQTSTVHIRPDGAVITKDASAEEMLVALKQAVAMSSGCKFAIGDLSNALAHLNGRQLAELARLARVSSSTPVELRRNGDVHFDFFAEALALPECRREALIDKVQSGEIPTPRILRKSIQLGKVATAEDMLPAEDGDRGEDNVIPHVAKIQSLVSKLDLGSLDDLTLSALREDLAPAVDADTAIAIELNARRAV